MKNSTEIQEFEDKVFDKDKNPEIKYNIDYGIESAVRYDFLVETYGAEKVKSVVDDMMRLHEQEYFNSVRLKLESLP